MSDSKSDSWLVRTMAVFAVLGLVQLYRMADEKELREGTPESIARSRRILILPGALFAGICCLVQEERTVLESLSVAIGVCVLLWIRYRWTLGALQQGTHRYYDYHPEQRPRPHVG